MKNYLLLLPLCLVITFSIASNNKKEFLEAKSSGITKDPAAEFSLLLDFADKNDIPARSALAYLHADLPENSDYFKKEKALLAQEFSDKYDMSVQEAREFRMPHSHWSGHIPWVATGTAASVLAIIALYLLRYGQQQAQGPVRFARDKRTVIEGARFLGNAGRGRRQRPT